MILMELKNIKTNIIAVNATALDKSGALTVLKQFIKHAGNDLLYHYICFIPADLGIDKPNNITFIEVTKMGWLNRILWDGFRFQAYLNKHRINCVKVVSLQNTTMNVKVKQIVYLHQSIPFTKIKWSIFKKEQFKLYLYKHFYKFFIFLYCNKDTEFVVQVPWMKKALCSSSNVDESNVHVIRPDVLLPTLSNEEIFCKVPCIERIFLYPATPYFYKNHMVIIEALKILKAKDKLINLKFQVTFTKESYPKFVKEVNAYGLSQYIDYLGLIPYEDLVVKYQKADVILFPSYVETFGLPLAEGASFGKPILCSDLPFSQDILSHYPGAVFLNHEDPQLWARAIENMLQKIDDKTIKCETFKFKPSLTWKDFFKLVSK